MCPLVRRVLVAGAVVLFASGCGESARLTVADGTGPDPAIPEPNRTLIPTIEVPRAVGWPAGAAPTPAPGLAVNAFATGLDHPRWLYELPNGDVLVAESNAPPSEGPGGIRGFFMRRLKKRGGGGPPSADRITLLRDTDGDGVADVRTALLEGLASPFGMALVGDQLYVANSASLVRIPYVEGETRLTAAPIVVAALPAGRFNQHWTRSLLASTDGATLYVGVGSASNVAEHGLEAEVGRAAVWAVDVATGATREVATGLRNPVGLAFEPATGALWTAVNERDELGSDIVPDYLTRVQEGAFYGWPYSYFGDHVDTRVEPRPDLVACAVVPDYALGPHTASLGLAWTVGDALPVAFRGGMIIGQHGSWNRRPVSGYRVVFVPFADGRPTGLPRDVLTGFLDGEGRALGRPVGVIETAAGALLVADDAGNAIWRVTSAR